MSKNYDFKKEWPKIRQQLVKVSKEALELAKKGEKELVDLSKKGKKRFDVANLNLRKEGVFKQIGREYVAAGAPEPHSANMKKLLASLAKIEKDILELKKQDKTKAARKGTTKSRSKKARKTTASKKAASASKDA